MKKVYMIEIFCRDTKTNIYNDNYKKCYTTYEKAKQVLNDLVKEEYESLMEMADENKTYYILDYIEDDREVCQREIYVETKDLEEVLTRYNVIAMEVDNTKVRYDMEEKFPINEKLANKINGMVYKGIQVNKHIDEKERNNKTIYHLHNDFNEHNEYTTDENRILMIYIDEMAQCVDNNISLNIEEDEYKSATSWLYKIMLTCGEYSRNEINIDEIIEELNKEHNWLIEVYKKGDDLND